MNDNVQEIGYYLLQDEYLKRLSSSKNITVEEELLNIPDLTTPEDETISKDEKLLLYQKIQKLNKETREVIYLRITGELSFKEIGTILNRTETWARVTFYRGKNQLKEVD